MDNKWQHPPMTAENLKDDALFYFIALEHLDNWIQLLSNLRENILDSSSSEPVEDWHKEFRAVLTSMSEDAAASSSTGQYRFVWTTGLDSGQPIEIGMWMGWAQPDDHDESIGRL